MVINAGETALTFYKATNHEEKPIIGNYKIN
jgi:cytochrome c oxidase assembly protein Cox11